MDNSKIAAALQKAQGTAKAVIGTRYIEASGIGDEHQTRSYIRIFPKSEEIDSIEAAYVFDELVEHYMETEAHESSGGFYAHLQGNRVETISSKSPEAFELPSITGPCPPAELQKVQKLLRLIESYGAHLTYKGKPVLSYILENSTRAITVRAEWSDKEVILEAQTTFIVLHWYTLA